MLKAFNPVRRRSLVNEVQVHIFYFLVKVTKIQSVISFWSFIQKRTLIYGQEFNIFFIERNYALNSINPNIHMYFLIAK